MRDLTQSLGLLLRRIATVFILYQICRLLFLLNNRSSFDGIGISTFIGGALFDLSAIACINLVFIPLHIIPGSIKFGGGYWLFLKSAFFTVNTVFIAANFVDIEYYRFTGRRSTFGLITASGMGHEIAGLIPSFLQEFWYIVLCFVALSLLFWRLLGRAPATKRCERLTPMRAILLGGVMLFAIGIDIVLIRGGFARKPLSTVDAIRFSKLGNSALVLNTPFSIIKSLGHKETVAPHRYFDSSVCDRFFDPVYRSEPTSAPLRKNVVILILESFGDENLRRGYTPFLDSLAARALYFHNGFANGKLSIDSVPSIISSIPSLMATPVIASAYSLNRTYGLASVLKMHGYNTAFFHGAFNGSQNFDQYCRAAGFDRYYGKNEYAGPEAFDGRWGVYDEEFLQFFNRELGSFRQPFFTVLFTISSHNPYTVPERYKGRFEKGDRKIQESVGYTDYALRRFFESAAREDWYNNTIFVITADHTSSEPTETRYANNVGKFRIPIIFFDPSNPDLRGDSGKNLQQVDIMPSLIDYLRISDTIVTFGKPFASSKDFVVYYLDSVYHLIQGDYYLAFDGKESVGLYNFAVDPLLERNLLQDEPTISDRMEKFIRAYIQTYEERMTTNRLTVESQPTRGCGGGVMSGSASCQIAK